jgi:GMP synthase (glutamine-hydrolysing)
MRRNLIIILDFGSQTTHLISRRIKEFGVGVEILEGDVKVDLIKRKRPAGLILSGGPASVYQENAPHPDLGIFSLGIPILGICYGLQLMGYLLQGKVVSGIKKEFGPANLKIICPHPLFAGVPKSFQVWMSHGDKVVKLPKGFRILGSTKDCRMAVIANLTKQFFGLQFHPEVVHTQFGKKILKNFVLGICQVKAKRKRISLRTIVKKIKE